MGTDQCDCRVDAPRHSADRAARAGAAQRQLQCTWPNVNNNTTLIVVILLYRNILLYIAKPRGSHVVNAKP